LVLQPLVNPEYFLFVKLIFSLETSDVKDYFLFINFIFYALKVGLRSDSS